MTRLKARSLPFGKHIVNRLAVLHRSLIIFFVFAFFFSPLSPIIGEVLAADYDFSIVDFTSPDTLEPNQEITLPALLENTGTEAWYKDALSGIPVMQLSYKWNTVEGEKTDLLDDVLDVTQAPNNRTHIDQEILLKAPSAVGTYNLELYLYSVDTDTYLQSSIPQVYPVSVSNPDSTAPTGSITLNDGALTTTDTSVSVKLTAQDADVLNEQKSGVGFYRLSHLADLSSIPYQAWDMGEGGTKEILETIPNTVGTYTWYEQFKDNAGFESEIYTASIDFISAAPTGSIEIDKGETILIDGKKEVQDNEVEIALNAQSNVNVTEYILSEDSDFSEDVWEAFETPGLTVGAQNFVPLPDETGDYSFYVKFKNQEGDESIVYSDTVHYKKYDIQPEVWANAEDVLYGGEMDYSVHLKNNGADPGYNARIVVELPRGFEYIEPFTYDNGVKAEGEGIQPTFTTTNAQGNQVLTYEGVADLLTGEETSVHFKAKVGGLNEGYELGDMVNIHLTGQLFKRDNFKVGFQIESDHEVELKPFVVDYKSSPESEGLVGEEIENKVEIQTNPDIPTDEKEDPYDPPSTSSGQANPMIVQFELDNGMEYVEDSYEINNYSGDNVIFNIIDYMPGGDAVLEWIFTDQVGTEQYENPIEIFFKTVIPKYDEEQEKYIEHNEYFENDLDVEGNYTNPPSAEDPEPESQTYTEEEKQKIYAKYFTVDKWGTPHFTEANNVITYTVQIKTSQFYDLVGITITDKLPDGITYQGNIGFDPNEYEPTLHDSQTDPTTGETTLTWRIQGIEGGKTYKFTYDVLVGDQYDIKEIDGDHRLLSNDYLKSTIDLLAVWIDNDPDVIRGNTDSDTGGAGTRVVRVEFEEGIKREDQTEYFDAIDVKIGDRLDVFAAATFPQTVPTNNFNYRTYIPVGTELDGDINVTTTGSFENDPTAYKEIYGGYSFDLGKAEPGATFRIDYKLNVLDDPNLKLAVKTRNLFRADYTNIDGDKRIYRNDVTLNLIEPRLEVNKRVRSGYLARGEEAEIELVIRNTGTDAAFNIQATDGIPSNTNFEFGIGNYELISPDSNVVTINYDEVNSKWIFDPFKLEPGEEVVLRYKVTTQDHVVYGDEITSEVELTTYQNRDLSDPLPARVYPTENHIFNWRAREPLLITDLIRADYSGPQDDFIPAGRDDEFVLEAVVESVGGAPVYNVVPIVDLGGIDLTEIEQLDVEVVEDNVTFDSINGFTFGANGKVTYRYHLKTAKYLPFDREYPVSVKADAKDALGDPIRKDGGAQCEQDTDHDDYTEKSIKIQKLDNTNPYGYIFFKIGDEYVFTTNQDVVDVYYEAYDTAENGVNSYVVGARFSNDKQNWYTLPTLGSLESDVVDLLEIDGEWNEWPEGVEMVQELSWQIQGEGRVYKYMQLVDLYGNVADVENSLLRDIRPPVIANVFISPFEKDISNPPYTGKFDNYVNFYAFDDDPSTSSGQDGEHGEFSGIGEYSYSLDNQDWTAWEYFSETINSVLVDFPPVGDGEELVVYLKIRDLAGNEYVCTGADCNQPLQDTITYTDQPPQISINLNNGDEYTNYSLVDLGLQIQDSVSGANKIRFGKDEADIQDEDWFDYYDTFTQYILPEGWESGTKQLCVQMQDRAALVSNVACDTIILDPSGPEGGISINNGNDETNTSNVLLTFTASDPALDDQTPGVGGIQMRMSETADDDDWTDWQPFLPTTNYQLPTSVGENILYVQYRDALGNKSPVYSDSIVLNPYTGTGNIVINNNDLFTNTKYVTLDLTVDMHDIGYDQYSHPILMRFIQTDDDVQPPFPPNVSNPDQDSKGWSYWEEYVETRDWDLQPQGGDPDYGKKNIYVQYMLPNGATTDVYHDSIIYAPYYGIEYLDYRDFQSADKTYGLHNVPSEVLSQDQFTLKLNVKNIGSFTWPKAGDNPVHVSYRWISRDSQGYGTIGDPVLEEYRGNAAILNYNTAWSQESGELTLLVDTPAYPGEYDLIIDAIHEGVTWFSTYSNPTPTYEITVTQNPDKEPVVLGINPETGEAYPTSDDWPEGVGGPPGSIETVRGIWQINSDPAYDYMIIVFVDGHEVKWNFIYNQGEQFIGKEVEVTVQWQDENWFKILEVKEVPKTWRAELWDKNAPPIIHAYRGNTVQVQPKYLNTGTGEWKRGEVFLRTIYPDDRTSVFSDSSWASGSRINLDQFNVAQNAVGTFTFNFKVKSNISIDPNQGYRDFNECFNVYRGGTSWERNDTVCFKIRVEMTEAEKRAYRCSQPHPVYNEPSKSSGIIGHINQNEEFVQVGKQGNWIRIYYPHGDHQDGWTENSDTCFEHVTYISNPIPKTEVPVTPRPTGDDGYVIGIYGLDVKEGPSDSFPTIAHIDYGTKVRVISQTNVGDKYSGWLEIELEDGTRGWVPKGYIDHTNDPPYRHISLAPPYRKAHVCTGEKVVRTGPGAHYPVKTTIYQGHNIVIIYKWNGWYQIYTDKNGNAGWVDEGGICQGASWGIGSGPIFTGQIGGETYYLGVPFSRPVSGYNITGGFNDWRGDHYHYAIDYSVGGQCGIAVRAAARGHVTNVVSGHPEGSSTANEVTIDHGNGITSLYLHLQATIDVNEGDEVSRGQVIGRIGLTGNTTGCHLHFAIYDHGTPVNPEEVFNSGLNQIALEIENFELTNLTDVEGFGGERDEARFWDNCNYVYKEIRRANVNDGTTVGYEGGIVYNHNIGEAFLVRNGIWGVYKEQGGPCGILGPPIHTTGGGPTHSEIIAKPSPAGTTGWVQRFQNGSIYFSNRWGGYAVVGDISAVYEAEGSTESSYGFPVKNGEKSGWYYCQTFEGKNGTGDYERCVLRNDLTEEEWKQYTAYQNFILEQKKGYYYKNCVVTRVLPGPICYQMLMDISELSQ